MKIQNNTKTTYIHDDLKLLPNGEVTEVENKKIAKMWLTIDGVVEYVAPEDAKAEAAALKAEIAKLKAENAKLKEAKKEAAKEKEAPELEALKIKADELGISYAKNIGIDALTKKIEEFEAAKDNEKR